VSVLRFSALPVQNFEDCTLNFDQIAGSALAAFLVGVGVPPVTLGVDGQIYFRLDGSPGAVIYQRRAGAWVATAA
jgi:hypothetical protein